MIKSFLEYVAEDIINKYGHDLSRTAIVFPNKRASLFLNEYLARLTDHPIWSPSYITISDLFRQQSTLQVADPIKLVCDLHRSFVACTKMDETLDHFYGWGQLLLADFDDIDKNMADADRVFANLRDIHELDDISYLTDEQLAIIQQFFSNFSEDHNSALKERFIKLWSHFADIYHDFNRRLTLQGLAYEGALYRSVVETLNSQFSIFNSQFDRYLFVGFNLLHQVEKQLFKRLRQEGKAYFYWDFDHYYMKQEAGFYLSQYLNDFPNELDNNDDTLYRQFQQPKQITYISAPTENIQARYMNTWLKEHQRYADGKRTAILLCDEHLLPVVIHCIPEEVNKVNVTTGYPLVQTPAASFVNLLMNLQIGGYRPRLMTAIRRHPYYKYLTDELLKGCDAESLFQTEAILQWIARLLRHVAQQAHEDTTTEQLASLRDEALFRTYTLINRLAGLVASGDLAVDLTTLQRLVNQLIQSTSIPFHGEPAEGIQIMGILESRNLDFDHVLMLSCNEGNMPKGVNDSSFIPHNLRKAYELTTVDHKTAIYAYYFYRLLQRASDITLVYNNATDEGHTGEMSRFMLQLLVESGHPIRRFTLKAGQQIVSRKAEPVEKTTQVMKLLMERFAKQPDTCHALLTPTAINTYRRCPLGFFYRYVCGLKEADDDELQIDDRLFGIVFHAASQYIYEQLMQQSHRIEKGQLQQLLQSKVAIEMAVDRAFREQLPDKKEYTGLQLINREVIIHYVRQLLQIDLQLAPFTIHQLEYEVVDDWTVHQGSHTFTTTIGGSIDRLDAVTTDQQERIRVIDYKTGGGKMTSLPDVESIFDTNDSHNGYYLQTLLYSSIVRQDPQLNEEQLPVSPALLFIQHAAADDYDPTLCFGKEKIVDVQPFIAPFREKLQECIDEIFNPDVPFQPVEDQKICRNCPYAQLCGRN
jgi:hypothetical protein